jgi:hypothetical protein
MTSGKEAVEFTDAAMPDSVDNVIAAIYQLSSMLAGMALATAQDEQAVRILARLVGRLNALIGRYYDLQEEEEDTGEQQVVGKQRRADRQATRQ